MFKKLMYSAGCAAVAVMCVCEGARGMEGKDIKGDSPRVDDESVLSYEYTAPDLKDDLPRLDDGQIIFYESEDKFLQDYMNSYNKWEIDGRRFISDEFVNRYIASGVIPVLNDGRPELQQWFDYTISYNVFLVGWGGRVSAGEFVDEMLRVYSRNGEVPDYLSSKIKLVKDLINWNPPAD